MVNCMDRNEIINELSNIFSGILHHENFVMSESLSAADVDGWDSLSHMNIITEIEHRFNVRFKLMELNKLNNLGNLITLLEAKLQHK